MWDSESISACLALQPVSVRYAAAGNIHVLTSQLSDGRVAKQIASWSRGDPQLQRFVWSLWDIFGTRDRRGKSRSGETVRTIQWDDCGSICNALPNRAEGWLNR